MTPQPDPEGAVNVEHRDPVSVLSIRENAAIADLAATQGERLRAIWESLQAQGLAPAGPPFVRYHTFGETETDMEFGVPVPARTAVEGRVTAGELPGGSVLITWHLGAHDSLDQAYGRLAAWLKEHDREAAGAAWEVYWWIDAGQKPDPSTWPAPAEWRTELVQPLAHDR
jgi:effector-binding domain-containing protein